MQLTEEFEAQSKRATPTASTKETLDAGATELVASKDTVDTQENDAAAADAGKTNHGSLVLPRDTAGAPETTAGNEVGIDSKGTSGPGTSHKAGERASLDADGWKPPLPRIPISGSLDPVTRVADHDLLITIRILPQLIRYRGSLRSGLISRGWGIGHDGNSIQVIACEKIPTGDAMRLVKHGMRKVVPTFAANRDDSDGYLMIMESDVSVAQGDVRTL